MPSPTSRSLIHLRKQDYHAFVVERFVRFPPPGHRIDLGGFGDIIAWIEDIPGVLAVQSTSGTNVSKHIEKLKDPIIKKNLTSFLKSGNRFEIHSWAKRGPRGKMKKWTVRIIQY